MTFPDSQDEKAGAPGPWLAFLPAIADALPVLLAYFDASQRYRYVNARDREWFGRPPEAVVGRHVRDVIGVAEYGASRAHIEAVLSGRPVSFERETESRTRGRLCLAVTLTPDWDQAGTVRGYAAMMSDVTARKASDDMLLDREAHLRAILESAVDGILTIDERGAVRSFNPAAERLFGYQEGEVVGRNVSLLMPPPYREEHDGYIHSFIRTGHARIIGVGREVEARRKDGTVFPIHLSVGKARLGGRWIFTGIIHDLTAKARLEQQLAQSQKMEAVGRLAGGVAHDFNNILLTILGRAEAAVRKLPARHPVRRQVVEIQKAGRRAASLTSQLLAVSRSQVLNPRVVDLNAVLRDTVQMLQRLIGEDVDFRMDLAADLRPVKVDPDQMVQVVLNLVVNARDAMPRGGVLVVETRSGRPQEAGLPAGSPGAVVLTVRDTGTGMDEATQARMFEPYFTTKGDKGTGLGLSTVYGIVKQSGGVLRVESGAGKGTAVSAHFPAVEERPEPPVKPRRPKPPRKRGGRVLLVEDDAAARGALEEFLREDGHEVLSAADGTEAERICRQADSAIDVVVTDTVMPRMSGPRLLEQLRAVQPGLRALLMSGHTPETVLEHGDVRAADAFLRKPFEVDDLLRHVRRLVAESSLGNPPGSPTPRTARRRA
jgi:PAS domain S-box-containing protein